MRKKAAKPSGGMRILSDAAASKYAHKNFVSNRGVEMLFAHHLIEQLNSRNG